MLHNEARKLLIKAWNKTHNAKEATECFGVKTGTVYRLEKRMRETGTVETRVSQRGRRSALSQTNLQNIDQMIRAQPDITVHEIREGFQLPVSDETVRRAEVKVGYVKKRSLSMLRNRSVPDVRSKRDDCGTFCGVSEGDFAPKLVQR